MEQQGAYDKYTLPDGKEVYFEKGTPEDVAYQHLIEKYPDSFVEKKFSENPSVLGRFAQSFNQSIQQGVESIVPAISVGIADLAGDEEALKKSVAQLSAVSAENAKLNPDPSSFAEVQEKYRREGFWSAAGETLDLAAQSVGSTLGFMAPSIALILGGAALGGPAGGAAGAEAAGSIWTTAGFASGTATLFAQQFAEDIERAAKNGEATTEDIELGKVLAAAAAQTALESAAPIASGVLDRAILRAVKSGNSVARRTALKVVNRRLNEAAEATYGSAAKEFLKVTAIETSTELAQQALQRAAAGETITPQDEEDIQEYVETAVAALFGSGPFAGHSAYRQFKQVDITKNKSDDPETKKRREEDLRKRQKLIDDRKAVDDLNKVISTQKLQERLIQEAERDAIERARLASEEAKRTVEEIRNAPRTEKDVLDLVESRWVDLLSMPEGAAGFARFLRNTIGKSSLKGATPEEIEKVYNRISAIDNTNDILKAMPLSDSQEAIEVSKKIKHKKGKDGKIVPENKKSILDKIKREIVKKEGRAFSSKRYLDLRSKSVMKNMLETGLLAERGTGKRKVYVSDPETISILSDPEFAQVAQVALRMAANSVRKGKTGTGTEFEVIGEFPTISELRDAVGPITTKAYKAIRDMLVRRGVLEQRSNRGRYFYKAIPEDLTNRVEHSRSKVASYRWIVRDKDGRVVRIAKSKKDAKSFVEENGDTELSEPTREKGYVVRRSEYVDKENGESRLVKSFPVEFVPLSENAEQEADALAENLGAEQRNLRDEFLSSIEDQMNVIDPEAIRRARSKDKDDVKVAEELVRKSPYDEDTVIARYKYGVRQGDPAALDMSHNDVLPDGESNSPGSPAYGLPFDYTSKLTDDPIPVVVKNGMLTEDGEHGFGAARMDKFIPDWRERLFSLMQRMTRLGNAAFDPRELNGFAEGAGRTVVVDGTGDDATYFVFDYVEDGDESYFHLYNMFTGRDSYAENVEDTDPTRGIAERRGQGVSPESVRVAENPDAPSVKKMSPAERAARDYRAEQTELEIQAGTLIGQREEQKKPKGLWRYVHDLANRYIGEDAFERIRRKVAYNKTFIEKHERWITDAETGIRLHSELSAAGAINALQRAWPMVLGTLDHGYIEVVRIPDKNGNYDSGSMVYDVKEFAFSNESDSERIYNEETGEFETANFSSDLFNESRGNATGGFLTILTALGPSGVKKMFQYARAIRSLNMLEEADANQETVEVPHTMDEIREALKIPLSDHRIAVAYRNYQNWQRKVTQFLVDTGVLSESDRAIWERHSDYVSFYVDMESDAATDLAMKRDIEKLKLGVPKRLLGDLFYRLPSKKYKGVSRDSIYADQDSGIEDFLTDPIEAQLNNTLAAIASGMMNVARKRAIRNEIALGAARPYEKSIRKNSPEIVVRENGEDVAYEVDDLAIMQAIEGEWASSVMDHFRNDKFLKWISTVPSNVLRETVVRNPGFVIPNTLKDSMMVWAMNGGDLGIVGKAFKRAARNINADRKGGKGKHESSKKLKLFGVTGGVEHTNITGNPAEASKRIMRQIETGSPVGGGPLGKIWNFLGEASADSESAVRELVYEHVVKSMEERLRSEGKYSDEDIRIIAENEGLYQAKEILNFSRRGDSKIFQAITALAPFLNARVQGIDLIVRGGFRTGVVGIDDSVSMEERQRGLIRRGSYIAAVSAGLAMMNFGDDDYENQSGYVRDNNWMIPIPGTHGMYFTIPTMFEFGFVFKTVPEQMARAIVFAANDDADRGMRDAKRAIGAGLFGTFGVGQAIPVVMRPPIELFANRSIHGGTPIDRYYERNLPASERYDEKTTAQARAIGKLTGFAGVSPRFIDNMVRTIFGGLGVGLWASMDTILRMPAGHIANWPVPIKPLPRLTDMTAIRRLIADGDSATGILTEYYEFRNELEEAYAIVNAANTPMEKAKLRYTYRNELLARKRLAPINRQMARLRNREAEARRNERDLSAAEMRRNLDSINKRRIKILDSFRKQRLSYDRM